MTDKNQAVVLVRAGIAKKVGRPNFSSYEANLQLEMTLDIGAVTDDKFPDFLAELYGKIQTEVDAQIAHELHRQDKTQQPKPVETVDKSTTQSNPANVLYKPTESFGEFLRTKSSELSVSPQQLVTHWYKQIVDGPLKEWDQQGKQLNDLWQSGSITKSELIERINNIPAY